MARQMACANDELIETPYAVVIWWSRGDGKLKMNRSLSVLQPEQNERHLFPALTLL
jgi:hypothetical protein